MNEVSRRLEGYDEYGSSSMDDDLGVPISYRLVKKALREKAAARGIIIIGGGGGGNVKKLSSESAGVQKEKSSPAPPAVAAAALAVEDTDALDCGVCFLPLKPPIFQCDVGHVLCSPCCDKLKATGKCHVCRVATGAYRRCHAMERLVESIRGPCPNAVHGCTARLAYYDQHSHHQMCPHVPCFCPGKDCGFAGSTEALLGHFTGTHGWPCTIKIRAGKTCSICLYNGFNFIPLADRSANSQGTITTSQYLFLLNVVRHPLGRAISVLFIGQKPPADVLKCVLSYALRVYHPHEHEFLGSHLVQSEINVECTNLSNGLPNPDDCFQFAVPDFILRDDDKDNAIQVKVRISISDLE